MTKNDSLIHSQFMNFHHCHSKSTLTWCSCSLAPGYGLFQCRDAVKPQLTTDRVCTFDYIFNRYIQGLILVQCEVFAPLKRCVFVLRKQHMFHIVCIIGGCGCWVLELPGSPVLKRGFPLPFSGPLLGIETEHGSKQHIH